MVTVYIIQDGSKEYKFYTRESVDAFLEKHPELSGKVVTGTEEEIAPPKQVPSQVPLWCLRTILIAMGLLDTVKQTIAAMPDGTLKIAAEQGIEYSNTVLRNSPTTLFIQQVLQLTSEQVDQIFIEADKVEA